MNDDFGYFLITIGLMWIIIATPFDVSFMKGSLVLPLGLIIIGGISILLGFFHINHASGMILAIFIALMIKSLTFPYINFPFTPTQALNETSNKSFILYSDKKINYQCNVCNDVINSSQSNVLSINARHTQGIMLESIEDGTSINVSFNFNNQTNGVVEDKVSLPVTSKSINYHISVGGLTLIPESVITTESLNASVNVGSLNLELGNINASIINLDTGVGSINANIPNINGVSELSLHSGVGSIEITLGYGIEYMLNLHSGLGSVDNHHGSTKSTGYDNATNKILINADTGVGSINVK